MTRTYNKHTPSPKHRSTPCVSALFLSIWYETERNGTRRKTSKETEIR
jgi:hypothetical protein